MKLDKDTSFGPDSLMDKNNPWTAVFIIGLFIAVIGLSFLFAYGGGK